MNSTSVTQINTHIQTKTHTSKINNDRILFSLHQESVHNTVFKNKDTHSKEAGASYLSPQLKDVTSVSCMTLPLVATQQDTMSLHPI